MQEQQAKQDGTVEKMVSGLVYPLKRRRPKTNRSRSSVRFAGETATLSVMAFWAEYFLKFWFAIVASRYYSLARKSNLKNCKPCASSVEL
jgi:hypothetical protein